MIRTLSAILSIFAISPVWAQVNLDDVDLNDLLNIKIQSASKQAEPWAEAPVPVSIVTRDMIKLSGARTIHEALILFVPGYTDSEDRNELNFAPRGIYSTSQQKVLVMVNGHRINSRSYLTAMPDYGIAVHNLERIEVLRGPGSSLYGNVALAGVVNLITLKGKDFNKNAIEAAAGDFDQRRLRFLTGSGGDDWDMLAWGQYYQTPGEDHKLNGNEKYVPGKTGSIRIDGVNKEPSHDVGMTYKKGKWSLFGASRRSQWIEPYGGNAAGVPSPYNYDAYRTFQEAGPGLGMSQQHLGVKYNNDLGSGWGFEFNPYYDNSNVEGILAAANNAGTVISWQDQNIGFITQANKSYEAFGGSGNFIFGLQTDAMEVTDSTKVTVVAGDFTAIDTQATRLLRTGGEEIYSAFIQEKHKFNDHWILNAGARYDYKNRKSGDAIDQLSPRLALIYLPNETWEYKLSYSESFVDAPYWYRYNSLPAFQGSELLEPELLKAAQLQAVWKSKGMRDALTIYHQQGEDLIVNNPSSVPTDPKYLNSGSIQSYGLENEFAWLQNSYQIFWTLAYSQASKADFYGKFDNQFAHVPTISSNLVFNYLFSKDITANVAVKYIGEQKYNDAATLAAAPVSKGIDAATIFNLGARWENMFSSGLALDGRIYNVMDTAYYQGGQNQIQDPYRQAGRWWIVSLGYDF